MTAQVFILNESHPENIEIERFDFDGAFAVVAKCPRCGAFENAYGIYHDSTGELARLAVKKLAQRPCNVLIGTTEDTL